MKKACGNCEKLVPVLCWCWKCDGDKGAGFYQRKPESKACDEWNESRASLEQRFSQLQAVAWDMCMRIGISAVNGQQFAIGTYHAFCDQLEALEVVLLDEM